MTLLAALASRCTKCGGAHPATFCAGREIAARKLGRGESLEIAAAASHMSPVLIRHWADIDEEFRAQIERARAKAAEHD